MRRRLLLLQSLKSAWKSVRETNTRKVGQPSATLVSVNVCVCV